jgi:hypothetical protein
MLWRSWLRHCATSQKVTSLIPNGVIGIFHWYIPSSCTIALGLTQPLTENEYQEYFLGSEDDLTTFMCWLSWNLGASASWNPQGLSRAVMGMLYLFSPPWNRVVPEKLTVLQLVKEFPTFCATSGLITAVTRAHHLCISWATWFPTMPWHPIFLRSLLIVPSSYV